MFQIPGAGALWRSLTGGTALPRTLPTMTGLMPNVGEVASYPQPTVPRMAVDEVLQQVWPQPWYGSGDLDPVAGESPENRACYLALYKKEPRLNAAIEGKVASIATMKFRWKGQDENSMADVEAAQFMDDTIKNSRHGGTIGLIASIMRAGQIYGWSAGEIKLQVQERGRFRGKWGLEHVRNLNTEPFIKLQLDVYRNITGVVNLIRGIQDYDPKKFVFYVNKPLFGNPFGQSDVQPAQRAAMLFREVYQVWYIALKRYGLPYMHGKVGNPNYRKALESALEDLQGSGWAVTGPEDEIVVLNLAAAASASGFEAMIDKVSEDIFFAVRGASTPSQVSSNKGSDVRGSSEDSKNTGQDPIEKLAAEEVCKSINQMLVPALMGPNFPPNVGMPYLSIGDADEDDAKTRLDIIDIIENKLGRPCSTEEIYEIGNVNPADPSNPDDAKRMQSLQQQQMKPQMPGMPGQGPPGGPPAPGGGSPATPKPPQPGGAPTQMSQPITGPDMAGNTAGMMGKKEDSTSESSSPLMLENKGNSLGEPVPAELIAAMIQAQMEGHPAAADAIAELGGDPEALKEFLADREAGTAGMTSHRMFSAFARTFGWFSDPSPRSPSRVTNSDTGQHRYGEAARRALAWQGREDKGEQHPQTTKDLLIARKAEAEPQREAARHAYTQAIANPGMVRPEHLKSLAEHLHTLTRDEVKSHLAQVQRKSQGRLKQDLVDALLSHVRDTAIEHHEAKLDPMKMDMDQDIAAKSIADLQGTSLPARKHDRDPDKEAAWQKDHSHATRQQERHEIVKAGTQGELHAPEKVSHGTPDTGSILKEERKFPDKTKSDPPEAQERTAQDEYRDEVAAAKPKEVPTPESSSPPKDAASDEVAAGAEMETLREDHPNAEEVGSWYKGPVVRRELILDKKGSEYTLYRMGSPEDNRIAKTDFAEDPDATQGYDSEDRVMHIVKVKMNPKKVSSESDIEAAASAVGIDTDDNDPVEWLRSKKVRLALEKKGFLAVRFSDVDEDGGEHESLRFLSTAPPDSTPESSSPPAKKGKKTPAKSSATPSESPAMHKPTLTPDEKKAATDELARDFAKASPATGGGNVKDPRGDVGKIAPEKYASSLPKLQAEITRHANEKTVGPSLDALYAKAGQGLTPQEFRAALLQAQAEGKIRMSGWSKTLQDIPRPDLVPIISDKIMGYAHPALDELVKAHNEKLAKAKAEREAKPGYKKPNDSRADQDRM